MSILQNKWFKYTLYVFGGLIVLLLFFNFVFMPWYVSADEVKVPKVLGTEKVKAMKILEDLDLEPVDGGERFDARYPKGSIIYQKPEPGKKVKEGRRVFLYVSSGTPMVKVPSLKGKAFRDAKFTLERMDLEIGDTVYVESDSPKDVIIDQEYEENSLVKVGTKISITISAGEETGIEIPDLLGKSLTEAQRIIAQNNLVVGRINYQPSFSLLPNTVIDQYPSKSTIVEEGSAVDLFVTKNVSTREEVEVN